MTDREDKGKTTPSEDEQGGERIDRPHEGDRKKKKDDPRINVESDRKKFE